MTLPAKSLSYRNRWLEELVQATPDDDIDCLPLDEQFVFPDQNTRVTLTWEVSQEEWTKVMTSVMYGADLAYPDCAINAMSIFIRTVSAIVDLCTEIADCIDTSAAVQTAISDYIAQQGGSAGAGTPDTVSPDANDNNLLPAGYTCDNDHLFGMSMEIVGMVHENTLELLQQIQASSGQWLDLVNSLLDNIPIVELVGISTEVVSWASASFVQDYESAWNTTTQQDIACELFCRIKDDCNLSWDDVWATYLDVSLLTPPALDTFAGWWDVIEAAVFGSDKARVAGVGMLGLAAMRFGGSFAQWVAGIRTLQQTIALAADATDPDWNILCTSCAPTYPSLQIGRCSDSFEAGTLTQLTANTWQLDSEVLSGNTYAVVEAVGGGSVQFTAITIDIAPPSWADSKYYSTGGCVETDTSNNPSVGWLNRTGTNSYYTVSAGATSFRLILTVAPL